MTRREYIEALIVTAIAMLGGFAIGRISCVVSHHSGMRKEQKYE